MLKKCDFYIEPRQSDKTTKLLKSYLSSYDKSLFIGINSNSLNERFSFLICSPYFPKILNNVISQNFREENLKGKRFKNIFIDEYLFFSKDNIKKCNEILPFITENIIIRTTSPVLINKNLYHMVRYARTKNLVSFLEKSDNVNFLLNNLITHPETDLYYDLKDNDFKYLSEEEFKTQIQGMIFYD